MAITFINPPFEFVETSQTINYTSGEYSTPFTQLFRNPITFTSSDSFAVRNIALSANKDKVNFEMGVDGKNTDTTYTLYASCIPDWDVDAVFLGTNATEQICNPLYAQYIKVYEIDGQFNIAIEDNGQCTWPTYHSVHVVRFKFVEGYDGRFFFENIQALKSARISSAIIGEGFAKGSGLVEVAVNDVVKRVEQEAFSGCTNMNKAMIGKGLETLAARVFDGCINFTDLYVYKRQGMYMSDYALIGMPNEVTLYVFNETFANQWVTALTRWNTTVDKQTMTMPSDPYDVNYTLMNVIYIGAVDNLYYINTYKLYQIVPLTTQIDIVQQAMTIAIEATISQPILIQQPTMGAEYICYRVKHKGEEIFSGRRYCPTNSETVAIRLNSVIAPFVTNTPLATNPNSITTIKDYALFEVELSYDEWITYASYGGVLKIYNDWSYSTSIRQDTSEIIEEETEPYQPIYLTYRLLEGETADITIYGKKQNGTSEQIASKTGLTQTTIMATVMALPIYTEMRCTIYPLGHSAIEYKFKVKQSDDQNCKARLIYRNIYGGYTHININDTIKEQKQIKIYNYQQDSIQEYTGEEIQYLKTYNKVWTLNTCIVSEDKSPMYSNAYLATEAYLQFNDNYTEDNYAVMEAVNITNTEADKKTYSNQSSKCYNYQYKVQSKSKRYMH